MINRLLLSILFSVFFLSAHSQDVIVFMNGDELLVKIHEVGPDEVKYQVQTTPGSPVYTVLKKSIFMIKFSDGTKQLIYTEPLPVTDTVFVIKGMTRRELNACSKGQFDAFEFHRRKFGNFMLGFLFGPFGIYGVAATNAAPPPPNVADKKYMENPVYLDCYNKAARKANIGHAVGGFITVSAAMVILYTVAP